MEIKPGTLCIAKSYERCVIITREAAIEQGIWFEAKISDNLPRLIFEEKDLIPLVENCGSYASAYYAIETNLPQILAVLGKRFEDKTDHLMQTKTDK